MDPIKTDDGQVLMVDTYGRVGALPPESLGQAFVYGYRFATPEESQHQYLYNEYGNSPIAAGAEGLARSATFGLYDVAANAIGDETREAVASRREFNQGAARIGEIGGYLLPVGAANAVGKVGKGAATLAGLGEATGIGGRVAAGVVRGTTEGAAIGLQQTVSNTALSDHPLSAEAIMSDLGSNVLYGGATGGVLGGAGGALGGVLSEVSSRVRARAQVVADRVAAEGEAQAALYKSPDQLYSGIIGATPEQRMLPAHEPTPPMGSPAPDVTPLPGGGTAAEPVPIRSSEIAQVPENRVGAEPYQAQGKLGDTLGSGPPAELVPKIESAYQRAQMQVSEIESRMEKVYRRDTINDLGDTIQTPRRGAGRPRGAEDPHLEDLLAAHKKAVGNLVELQGQVDAIRAAPAPVEPTLRARPADVAPPPVAAPAPIADPGATADLRMGRGLPPAPAAPASDVLGTDAGPFKGTKLEELQNYLRLQKEWWASHGGPDVEGGDSLTSARRAAGFEDTTAHAKFEEAINKKLDELGIGKNTPPPGAETPPAPPPDVVGPDMGQPTPGPAPRPAPPNNATVDVQVEPGGPSKKVGGGFAGAAQKIAGGLGAHIAGAVGWGIGSKFGHPFLAAGLARAAFRAVKGAIGGGSVGPAVGARIGELLGDFARGVEEVTSSIPRAGAAARKPEPATSVLKRLSYAPDGATPPPPVQRGDSLSSTFAKRAAELAASANNMPATQARIHTLLLGLRVENPKAADQVEQSAMAKLSFLWDKLPKNPGLGSPLDGFARGQRMSDAAVHDFARYAAAAETPQRMLDELAAGRLSPQTVEATKAVFPETFSAVREQLINRMDEMGKMPYARRVQLSVLFETPLDSTMRPETVAALQASFQNESGSPGGMKPPPGPANGPKNFTPPMPTQAQSLAG